MMWKEEINFFKVLSQHLPAGTEKNHRNTSGIICIIWIKTEIQSITANHCSVTPGSQFELHHISIFHFWCTCRSSHIYVCPGSIFFWW